MSWHLKTFENLSNSELYLISKERIKIFVVEQNCPYQEIDDNDLIAKHLFKMEDRNLSSYCRIIPKQDGIHIGRVLVVGNKRGEGKGRILIKKAMDVIKYEYGDINIHIQAQAHLKNFYEEFGFLEISEPYPDEGILHIDMVRKA